MCFQGISQKHFEVFLDDVTSPSSVSLLVRFLNICLLDRDYPLFFLFLFEKAYQIWDDTIITQWFTTLTKAWKAYLVLFVCRI